MDSLYKKLIESQYKYKNRGFDYSKNMLVDKFLSKKMFMNENMSKFLVYIDKILILMLNSVKHIHFYFNYTINKDDNSINI